MVDKKKIVREENVIRKDDVKKVNKKCACIDTKIIADYTNDTRDERGQVKRCNDCGRIFE